MITLIASAAWTEQDSADAKRVWADYQAAHDLSDRIGETAGVDPRSGGVWIGDSIEDVVAQREAEGLDSPLYFFRIGYDYYYPKGGRR